MVQATMLAIRTTSHARAPVHTRLTYPHGNIPSKTQLQPLPLLTAITIDVLRKT